MIGSTDSTLSQQSSLTKHIDVPFIFYAFAAACLGYLAAVMTLRKRSLSHKRLKDNVFLAGAALAIAGTSNLMTNFVAHWALRLTTHGDRLRYSGPLSVLAIIVPSICIFLAFHICISAENDSSQYRVMLRFMAAGMLAGLGHVFVELINLQTVRNFDVYLPACHYVFAALVSCTGNAVVLAAIFRLRYHWTIRWYCLLALYFASSVVALSVEALFLQGLTVHENERTALERDAPHTFATAQVLLLLAGGLSCLTLICYFLWLCIRRRQLRNRAKQVKLAAVCFNRHGQVLIKIHDGGLPMQQITTSDIDLSEFDILETTAPVFQWMFKASCAWHLIIPMLTRMRLHLMRVNRCQTDVSREEPSTHLCELFCCGAQQLAAKIGIPLRHMGVCFEKIAQTGRRKNRSSSLSVSRGKKTSNSSTGQIIFLVKHFEPDSEHIIDRDFRFASPAHALPAIAASLNLPKEETADRIRMMGQYRPLESAWPSGLHVGYFGVQANVTGGFRILVPRGNRTCLPIAFVQEHTLQTECLAFVRRHFGKKFGQVRLCCDLDTSAVDMQVEAFRSRLMLGLNSLQEHTEDADLNDAYLLPELVRLESKERGTTQLLLFKYVIPIHAHKVYKHLDFIPFPIFNLFQQAQGPELETSFMRSLHTQFTPIFDALNVDQANRNPRSLEGGRSGSRSLRSGVLRMFEGVMIQEALDMRVDTEEQEGDVSSTVTVADGALSSSQQSQSGARNSERQVWVLESYPELPNGPSSQPPSGTHRVIRQPQITSSAMAGNTEVLTWAEVALRTRPHRAPLAF